MYTDFLKDASLLSGADLKKANFSAMDQEAYPATRYVSSVQDAFRDTLRIKGKNPAKKKGEEFHGDFEEYAALFVYHYITFLLRGVSLPDVTGDEIDLAMKKNPEFFLLMTQDRTLYPDTPYEQEQTLRTLVLYHHITEGDEAAERFLKKQLARFSKGKSRDEVFPGIKMLYSAMDCFIMNKEFIPPTEDEAQKMGRLFYDLGQLNRYTATQLLYDFATGESDEKDEFYWKSLCQTEMSCIHPVFWNDKDRIKRECASAVSLEDLMNLMARRIPELGHYHQFDENEHKLILENYDFLYIAHVAMKMFPNEQEQKRVLMLIEACFMGRCGERTRQIVATQKCFELLIKERKEEEERKAFASDRLKFDKEKDVFNHDAETLKGKASETDALKQQIEALNIRLRKKEKENAYLEKQLELFMTFDDKEVTGPEEDEPEEEFPADSAQEEDLEREIARIETETTFLKEKRITLYGGHQNLVTKLKERFPAWTYIGVHGKAKKEQVAGKDAVVLLTDYVSHASYFNAKENALSAEVPLCYARGTNIDMVTDSLYAAIKNATEFEKKGA